MSQTATQRPRALDLFCGQGGVSVGLHRAGFDVTGVDIAAQPRFPFEFHQADALTFGLSGYDFIWASPPCQQYSIASKSWNGKPATHPDLIEPIRARLNEQSAPYIIENVYGAPLGRALMLCGTMFPPLRVLRHRYFESNVMLFSPPHGKHPPCFTMDKRKKLHGKLSDMDAFVQVNGGGNCSIKAARSAMGIDWMNKPGLNNAIPPVYAEFLGRQMLAIIARTQAEAA